jgi:tetratricopeptide (TPR) repeat protein
MGIALKEQGKLEETIEAFNKALSIKPEYAEAYNNTTETLKVYSPQRGRFHNLFNIDSKIKKLSPRILYAKSNREIIDNLAVGLSYITEESFEYKTPLSQIYKRNTVDLNCKRHKKIFDTRDIIPEFCFECFKVQVEVGTFIDLVKLTSLFYKFDIKEDLTKKTIIELRPNISGYYKGLIYCNGLDKAEAVKILLDISLKEVFGEKTISIIKRGCSEYPLKFPSYGEIPKNQKKIMSFPKEWRVLEKKFDQDELIEPRDNIIASLPEFCLGDFYIIQKWIDYAKGIGDQSIRAFTDRPILFKDIYEKAKIRSMS